MRINIDHAVLFLACLPSLVCLSHAGCSGSCSVSGGVSYDFLGDSSINPSMDTFDDFIRDKLGQTSLSTKSISPEDQSINSSINRTDGGNATVNRTMLFNVTDSNGTGISDSKVVKLGGSAGKDMRQSTFASTIFSNNMM